MRVKKAAGAPLESTAPVARKPKLKTVRSSRKSGARIEIRYHIEGAWLSQEELFRNYASLLRYIVRSMGLSLPPLVERDDLISEGYLGLLDAASKYDGSRKNKFATYAQTRIRGRIIDFLRQVDPVPRGMREDARRLVLAEQAFYTKHGRTPNRSELAAHMDITVKELEHLRIRAHRTGMLSLDATVQTSDDPDGDVHLAGLLTSSDEDALEGLFRGQLRADVERIAEKCLTNVEYRIVTLHYFDGRTFKEITHDLGLSETRVSRIGREATEKLAAALGPTFARDRGLE